MRNTDQRARWRMDEEAEERERPQVVLAEDNLEMRKMLVSTLRGDGYTVIEIPDGTQLLHYLATHTSTETHEPPIDLIISDLRMPGRSGLEVLAGLRMNDCATPFILLTAFGDRQTHEDARRLGATAVFDKPLDLDDLRTVVWNMLP